MVHPARWVRRATLRDGRALLGAAGRGGSRESWTLRELQASICSTVSQNGAVTMNASVENTVAAVVSASSAW